MNRRGGYRTMHDRRLYIMTVIAMLMAAGHHVDHIIRGNQVGWPLTPEVNAFSFSLAIYPAILIGLYLYATERVGPGFWVFLSGGGAIFLTVIHFSPIAVEPPHDIIDLYEPRAIGWLAFGWLVALIGVLVVTSLYEASLWLGQRGNRVTQ
jgi:hypothetical protein